MRFVLLLTLLCAPAVLGFTILGVPMFDERPTKVPEVSQDATGRTFEEWKELRTQKLEKTTQYLDMDKRAKKRAKNLVALLENWQYKDAGGTGGAVKNLPTKVEKVKKKVTTKKVTTTEEVGNVVKTVTKEQVEEVAKVPAKKMDEKDENPFTKVEKVKKKVKKKVTTTEGVGNMVKKVTKEQVEEVAKVPAKKMDEKDENPFTKAFETDSERSSAGGSNGFFIPENFRDTDSEIPRKSEMSASDGFLSDRDISDDVIMSSDSLFGDGDSLVYETDSERSSARGSENWGGFYIPGPEADAAAERKAAEKAIAKTPIKTLAQGGDALSYIQVYGDGADFFRSVAKDELLREAKTSKELIDVLQSTGIDNKAVETRQIQLRARLMKYMRKNKDDVESELERQGTEETFESYVEKMAKSDEYATDLEITFTERMLNRPINVYQVGFDQGKSGKLAPAPARIVLGDRPSGEPIDIFFELIWPPPNHFNLLLSDKSKMTIGEHLETSARNALQAAISDNQKLEPLIPGKHAYEGVSDKARAETKLEVSGEESSVSSSSSSLSDDGSASGFAGGGKSSGKAEAVKAANKEVEDIKKELTKAIDQFGDGLNDFDDLQIQAKEIANFADDLKKKGESMETIAAKNAGKEAENTKARTEAEAKLSEEKEALRLKQKLQLLKQLKPESAEYVDWMWNCEAEDCEKTKAPELSEDMDKLFKDSGIKSQNEFVSSIFLEATQNQLEEDYKTYSADWKRLEDTDPKSMEKWLTDYSKLTDLTAVQPVEPKMTKCTRRRRLLGECTLPDMLTDEEMDDLIFDDLAKEGAQEGAEDFKRGLSRRGTEALDSYLVSYGEAAGTGFAAAMRHQVADELGTVGEDALEKVGEGALEKVGERLLGAV